MKFRAVCRDRQAGEIAVKYLSQEHNRIAQIDFEQWQTVSFFLECALKLKYCIQYCGKFKSKQNKNIFLFQDDFTVITHTICVKQHLGMQIR